jgi:hypothetical protein
MKNNYSNRLASEAFSRTLTHQLKRKDLAIGISAAVASTAAFAQTEAPVAAEATSIEEILVTARKRTEPAGCSYQRPSAERSRFGKPRRQ